MSRPNSSSQMTFYKPITRADIEIKAEAEAKAVRTFLQIKFNEAKKESEEFWRTGKWAGRKVD